MIKKGDYVFHTGKGIYGVVLNHPSITSGMCTISDLDKELIGVESKLVVRTDRLKRLDNPNEDQGG